HIISGPQMSPAWTVTDGVLYFSLSQEGLKSAIENNAKNTPIFDNPQFAELWKKVGVKDMSGFSFVDYKKVAAELHPLVTRALEQRKAARPEEKNPFVLPPL